MSEVIVRVVHRSVSVRATRRLGRHHVLIQANSLATLVLHGIRDAAMLWANSVIIVLLLHLLHLLLRTVMLVFTVLRLLGRVKLSNSLDLLIEGCRGSIPVPLN